MEKMLNLPYEEDHAHPLKRPLQLIAWTVCGDSTRQMVFQQNKQTFLAMHAGIKSPNSINPHGNSGWAGVTAGTLIPFQFLS